MATITLTKVNIGENRYFHVFRNNATGFEIKVSTTKNSYETLGTSNPSIPKRQGATWIRSLSRVGFDTKTGELSDNQYATQENGAHWVKIPNYPTTKLPNEYVVNDILSDAGIQKIIEMNQDS